MLEWQIPLKSIYREIIDFSLEANSNNYIQAGWQPMGIHAEFSAPFAVKKVVTRYRVGWLRGAGEPPRPPIIDEVPPPRFHDFGPSAN